MTRTILITGATSGLGLELARRYRRPDQRIVLVGRQPRLALTDPIFDHADYLCVDLVRPDAHSLLCQQLCDRSIDRLDLVIQNAATGWFGRIEDQPTNSIRDVMQVNLLTPIALTQALHPLVANAAGKFVTIGSMTAYLPAPEYAVYAATKAGLDAFVRAVRSEAGDGVRHQIIHPGAIRTDLFRKIGVPAGRFPIERFPSPADIARQIHTKIERSDRNTVVGLGNRLVTTAGYFFPRLFERRRSMRKVTTVDKRALVTGGAAGIGAALVRRLLADGYHVDALDRDADRLAELKSSINSASLRCWTIDLADLAAIDPLLGQLLTTSPFDLVVHNAGISAVGPHHTLPIDAVQKVLTINFVAPAVMTAGLLHRQGWRGGGTMVFVSSLSNFVGYPGAAGYAASKMGLASLASSLAADPMYIDRSILTVYPGPTRTDHARRYSPDNSRADRRQDPDALAQQILNAVHRRRRTLIPGVGNRLIATLGQFAPAMTTHMMRRLLFDRLRQQPPRWDDS